MAWDDLSIVEKADQLVSALLMSAMGIVAPRETNHYITVKSQLTSTEDLMRLDVDFWFPLVRQLREQGRVPTAEEIRQKAESMLYLSSEEMRKALTEYAQELRNR